LGNNYYYGKIKNKFSKSFEVNNNEDLKLKNINNKYLIRGINDIKSEYKINKYYESKNLEDIYLVTFHNDVSLKLAKEKLIINKIKIIEENDLMNILVVKISKKELSNLLDIPEINRI
jgi:phosphate uptake regulator